MQINGQRSRTLRKQTQTLLHDSQCFTATSRTGALVLQFAICQTIKVQNDLFGRSRSEEKERAREGFCHISLEQTGFVQQQRQPADCEWDVDAAEQRPFSEGMK